MAKMKIVNGKLVPWDESPAENLVPEPVGTPISISAKDVKKANNEPDEEPQVKSAVAPLECADCHAWVSVPDTPGISPVLCPKCSVKRAKEADDKINSQSGTPFDNMMAEAVGPGRVTGYSPSVQDFREIFNREVENHGILPDEPFVKAVLGHKFVKAVKDCTLDEIADQIEMIDAFMFRLWPARRARKMKIDEMAVKASKEQKERLKALDEGYKPEVIDERSGEDRRKTPRPKKEKAKPATNKKAAIESLVLLYQMNGQTPEDALKTVRETFPALFE